MADKNHTCREKCCKGQKKASTSSSVSRDSSVFLSRSRTALSSQPVLTSVCSKGIDVNYFVVCSKENSEFYSKIVYNARANRAKTACAYSVASRVNKFIILLCNIIVL